MALSCRGFFNRKNEDENGAKGNLKNGNVENGSGVGQ